MPQYRRIPTPVMMRLSLYRNASLWEEQVALARLVVGGGAHGQVLISQKPDLRVPVSRDLADVKRMIDVANAQPEIVAYDVDLYSSAEVGVGDRIYRTWLLAGTAAEVHLAQALMALADADPAKVETCRVA